LSTPFSHTLGTEALSETLSTDDENFLKLEKRLFHQIGKAIGDFSMIEEGDRILVGVSGGKDSWVLLHVLDELRKKAPINFELIAANLDQGYPGFRQDEIEDYLAAKRIPFIMKFTDIAAVIEEKNTNGAVPCSLCSRLRRGNLYGMAAANKCNKIALGHHKDDFIETLLLNQFFVGRIGAMAPKLKSDDGVNTVIRPLVYVGEDDIIEYARARKFPIVCCQCPLACGEAEHLDFKRRRIKNLLKELQKEIPHIKDSLLSSLTNIQPSHLLDKRHWNF